MLKMESWVAKVIALVSLFLAVLVFGLLPIRVLRLLQGTGAEKLIGGFNCFGGGVFLATSLLHLLPDVRRDIDDVLEAMNKTTNAGFPLAEFLTCIGFFIVMFIEHAIVLCCDAGQSVPVHQHRKNSELDQESSCILPHPPGSEVTGYGTIPGIDGMSRNCADTGISKDRGLIKENGGLIQENGGLIKEYGGLIKENGGSNSRISLDEGFDLDLTDNTSVSMDPSNDDTDHLYNDKVSDHEGGVRVLRSLLFLFALSIHTIFEGLALGLQSSSQEVFTLLVAVLLHKVVISFTVGLQFAETFNSHLRTVLSIVMLSIMAPVGVAIGLAVTETGNEGLSTDIASAVLQGLATGTFLYVTFFEVLLDQMKDNHSLLKVLAVFLGFGCIAVLNYFTAGQE